MLHQAIRNDNFKIQDSRELGLQSEKLSIQGRIQGGGALVSCSTSTPINHIVFFLLQNTSCIRKPQVISGGGFALTPAPSPLHPHPCTLTLDPPLILETLIKRSGS